MYQPSSASCAQIFLNNLPPGCHYFPGIIGNEHAIAHLQSPFGHDRAHHAPAGVKKIVQRLRWQGTAAGKRAADVDGNKISPRSRLDHAEVIAAQTAGRHAGCAIDCIPDGGSPGGLTVGVKCLTQFVARLAVEHRELEVLKIVVGVGINGNVHGNARSQGFREWLRAVARATGRGTMRVDHAVTRQDRRIGSPVEAAHVRTEYRPIAEEPQRFQPLRRSLAPQALHRFCLAPPLRQMDVQTGPQFARRRSDRGQARRRMRITGMGRHHGLDEAAALPHMAPAEVEVGGDLSEGALLSVLQDTVLFAEPDREQARDVRNHRTRITACTPAFGKRAHNSPPGAGKGSSPVALYTRSATARRD